MKNCDDMHLENIDMIINQTFHNFYPKNFELQEIDVENIFVIRFIKYHVITVFIPNPYFSNIFVSADIISQVISGKT